MRNWARVLLLTVCGTVISIVFPCAAQTTLRLIPQADLTVTDPIFSAAYITRNYAYLVYDTLFGTDEHMQPQPQMVDHWQISPDGLTYSFTLRPGLKFHDGQPVRAADCIASLQRWMKRDVLGQALAATVQDMRADSDQGFSITLSKPFPLLLNAIGKLSSNVPVIMPERLARTDAGVQVTDPTGSGPFIFDKAKWRQGDRAIFLRNPDYIPRKEPPSWTAGGKIARVDRIEWVIIPDAATAANALLKGEVDWWQQVPTDQVPYLARSPDITVVNFDPIGLSAQLMLNHTQPPFNNPHMRQALLHAIDQKEFLESFAGDPKFWRTCYSFFNCGSPMASDTGLQALEHGADLAGAKALMQQAGYHGEPIVILDPTDYPSAHAMALMTAEVLHRMGANVDLQAMAWGGVLSRRTSKEPADKGGWSIFTGNSAGPDMLDPAVNLTLRANGAKAFYGWPDDPKLEALRGTWLNTEGLAAQQAIAAQIQMEAAQEVPFVPLGQYSIPTAYRNNLHGVLSAPVLLMWNVAKQ